MPVGAEHVRRGVLDAIALEELVVFGNMNCSYVHRRAFRAEPRYGELALHLLDEVPGAEAAVGRRRARPRRVGSELAAFAVER